MTTIPLPTFIEIMTELGGGQFKEIAGELLLEIAHAVATNGGKGRLNIGIDVELKEGQLAFDGDFKSRKPYPPLPTSTWWITQDNQLSLFDPNPEPTPTPRPRGGGGGRQPH
jgi:hypothetical protein